MKDKIVIDCKDENPFEDITNAQLTELLMLASGRDEKFAKEISDELKKRKRDIIK